MIKFYVELTDGIMYKMQDMCNCVDYSDPNYLRCYQESNDFYNNNQRKMLALFPHCQVKRIINVY